MPRSPFITERESLYKSKDPVSEAMIAALRGGKKAVSTALEPYTPEGVMSGKSIENFNSGIDALSHPKETASSMIAALRQATHDPEMAGQLLTSMLIPSPGELGGMRDIIAGPKGIKNLGKKSEGEGLHGYDIAEIPDFHATLKDQGMKDIDLGHFAELSEVLNHPELFKAYPELRKTLVARSMNSGSRGSYTPQEFSMLDNTKLNLPAEIKLDRRLSPKETRNVLLHEIQHGVQHEESYPSFYSGSNSSNTYSYFNNPGEIEARTVQARDDLHPSQLKDFPLEGHLAHMNQQAKNLESPVEGPELQLAIASLLRDAKRSGTVFSLPPDKFGADWGDELAKMRERKKQKTEPSFVPYSKPKGDVPVIDLDGLGENAYKEWGLDNALPHWLSNPYATHAESKSIMEMVPESQKFAINALRTHPKVQQAQRIVDKASNKLGNARQMEVKGGFDLSDITNRAYERNVAAEDYIRKMLEQMGHIQPE